MHRALALLILAAACSSQPSTPVPGVDQNPITTAAIVASTRGVTIEVRRSDPAASSTTGPTRAAPTKAPLPTVAPPATLGPRDDWFVVWVTGWMPDGITEALRTVPGVEVVSEVWVGNAHVVETRDAAGAIVDATAPRFVLPIELHAIDAKAHAGFVPMVVADLLSRLASDEVLLGATSARLRRLSVGGSVTLEDGTRLIVAGVVEDRWVGFAEMVTTSPDAVALGADRPRYAVVQFEGQRTDLAAAAAALTDRAVRVWAEGEVSVLRHADAVQPQAQIKERFGEFSYRPLGGQRVEIDPDWVDANIVTVELPLIGAVRCHRDFAQMLRRVMEQLESGGDGRIIDPSSNLGCFNQRFIANRRDLSRHAWGIAADINWGNDLESTRSPVAPELLAAMASAGITSGHDWINPDPGHFEWVGD